MNRFVKIGLPVAALGAVLALSTPLGAAAAALIDSGDIKDQTIQSRDIAEAGVGASEVRNGSLTSADLAPATAKTYLQGKTAFEQNKGQDAKISDLEDRVEAEEAEGDTVGLNTARAGAGYTTFAKPGVSVLFNKCDVKGQVAISGGYRLNGHAAEAFQGGGQPVEGISVIATEPVGVVGDDIVNTYQHPDFPQTEDGGFQANAWAVTFHNTTGDDLPVRVFATCVSPN